MRNEESTMVVVALTPDQLRALIQIVDNADIKGRAAALVVSIQRALADATAPPQECPAPGTRS